MSTGFLGCIDLRFTMFLASKGNEYFCEIDDEYIVDGFNLTVWNAEVQGCSGALELITDTAPDKDSNDEQRDQLETAARQLYGLIHARFIITSRGLAKMVRPSLSLLLFFPAPANKPLISIHSTPKIENTKKEISVVAPESSATANLSSHSVSPT
ncbi:casein kinase II subunit beta, partial [Phenoliferia sp. Uapishka_3]